MQKKYCVFFMVFALCTCMLLTASAEAGFTEAFKARLAARKALTEKYGLDADMQTYFEEAVRKEEDGYTVFYYTMFDDMDYVLGRYSVRVLGDKAEARWSWDGQEVPYAGYGLASNAWGSEQLKEIWLINKQTADLQNYALIARALSIGSGHGAGYISELPVAWNTDDPASYDPSKITLSAEQSRKTALDAVRAVYGFGDQRMSRLRVDEEMTGYDTNDEGEPVMIILCEMWDELQTWQEGDGSYAVTVNQVTGLVENIVYVDGIVGNG